LRINLLAAVSMFVFGLLVSCTGRETPPAGPVAVVSILPQRWFVERIAAGRFPVTVLAGPGQNPHNYEPSPRQMTDLTGAAFWLLSGTEFEISLKPKIAALFPGLLIIDGTEGVRFRTLEDHEDEDETRAGNGHIDRHTWLGSGPAKIMAVHILNVLIDIDPSGAALYRTNYDALLRDIDGEYNTLRTELAPLRGRTVLVYHPSFGYFLDEFGLIQKAVETGGKEPAPRMLRKLMEEARQERAAAIFVQAQFPLQIAQILAAALNMETVPLDPLSPDWLANIRVMGETLAKSLSSGGGPAAVR
jgi:zinc transport system substrate-binding protein